MNFWSNPKWYWLRWVLVLPVALLANILTGLFFNLLVSLSNWYIGGSESSPHIYIGKCVAGAIGGYWCISYGTLTAPTHRKQTALILMVIFILITGMAILSQIQQKNWGDLFITIISIGGIVSGYLTVEKEDSKA